MSAIFDQGPPPPCPAPFNMAAYVLAGAGAPDGRIAFEVPRPQTQPGSSLSYGTLRTHVLGIATGLAWAIGWNSRWPIWPPSMSALSPCPHPRS